jgi:GGDEF domain-containing protein
MSLFDNAITMQYTPEENNLLGLTRVQLEELKIKLYSELQDLRFREEEIPESVTSVGKAIRILQKDKRKKINTYHIRLKRVNQEISRRRDMQGNKDDSLSKFFRIVAKEELDQELYDHLFEKAKTRLYNAKEKHKQKQEFI